MITLTSDFGLKDPYAAEMKGVILTINPNATIVDVTHEVEKFNFRMGAFILASAIPYFPDGTVHVAVVDPGVGTQRRSILIQTTKAFFVGPDNGILMLASQNQSIKHVYQITNPKLMLPKISSTFHGRDIFAPAAAYLTKEVAPTEFGAEIKNPVKPDFTQAKRGISGLIGEVLHIDDFGNIITNIAEKDILQNQGKPINIEWAGVSLKLNFCKTYAEAKTNEPIALIGSHGFMEIALNQGNAAEKFHVKSGDKVAVKAD
jgi:S-adenosylmethionine hydrolase